MGLLGWGWCPGLEPAFQCSAVENGGKAGVMKRCAPKMLKYFWTFRKESDDNSAIVLTPYFLLKYFISNGCSQSHKLCLEITGVTYGE